jgi:hypothetical protein
MPAIALPPTLSGILSSSIITGTTTTSATSTAGVTGIATGESSPAVPAQVVPVQAATAAPVPATVETAPAVTDPAASAVTTPTSPAAVVTSPAAPTVVTVTAPAATGTADAKPATNEIIFVFPSGYTPAGQRQPSQQTTEVTTTGATPEPERNIVLVNAEDRIPEGEQAVLSPEQMIAPINGIVYYVPDEYTYRPETVIAAPVATNPTTETGNALPARIPAGNGLSPFTVPVINGMEKGMWYVQVGAFTHPRSVENEIDRIGTAYPTVVQIAGTEANPVYRVLLGPLSQGESGAMLQRFKSIGYKDAFVWSN